MATLNQVYKGTITAGGGTFNLPVSDSTTSRYIFSGTSTLAANWVIQPSGSPTESTEFDIRWQAPTTLSGNTVTIFGRVLTEYEALQDLIITCYYNGSAWDVDINIDNILWEPGDGTNSTTLISGSNTVSGARAFSAGQGCTSSGDDSFSIQDANTASGAGSFASGSSCTASGDTSIAMGGASTASGTDGVAVGRAVTASGNYSNARNRLSEASGESSNAEGYITEASESFTHSGGTRSKANRYGQFSRASGKHNVAQTTEFAQYSKVTVLNTTEDATPEELYLDGVAISERVSIFSNSSVIFTGELIAVQDSGAAGTAGDTAAWRFTGVIKNVGGTTALVDTVLYQDSAGAWGASAQRAQDAAAAAWVVAVTADNGNDALVITVTGEANKTIYWLCNLELTEIKHGT